MPAEISTGILCMGNIYKRQPSVSMLMVDTKGTFYKKATGKIFFTCLDGTNIREIIEEVIASKQSKTITCFSTGKNENDETVAEFCFTWSFKVR